MMLLFVIDFTYACDFLIAFKYLTSVLRMLYPKLVRPVTIFQWTFFSLFYAFQVGSQLGWVIYEQELDFNIQSFLKDDSAKISKTQAVIDSYHRIFVAIFYLYILQYSISLIALLTTVFLIKKLILVNNQLKVSFVIVHIFANFIQCVSVALLLWPFILITDQEKCD
jgi:hypothetical protein